MTAPFRERMETAVRRLARGSELSEQDVRYLLATIERAVAESFPEDRERMELAGADLIEGVALVAVTTYRTRCGLWPLAS